MNARSHVQRGKRKIVSSNDIDTVIMMHSKRILLIIPMICLSLFSTLPSLAQWESKDFLAYLTPEERAFLAGKQLRPGVDVASPAKKSSKQAIYECFLEGTIPDDGMPARFRAS